MGTFERIVSVFFISVCLLLEMDTMVNLVNVIFVYLCLPLSIFVVVSVLERVAEDSKTLSTQRFCPVGLLWVRIMASTSRRRLCLYVLKRLRRS